MKVASHLISSIPSGPICRIRQGGSIGYAIFGIGVDDAGITVSKTIVKWLKGKELALAMGMRWPRHVWALQSQSSSRQPLPSRNTTGKPSELDFFGLSLLAIGFLTFLVYVFMDAKIDKQQQMREEGPSEISG
jgi:hypothetical protein